MTLRTRRWHLRVAQEAGLIGQAEHIREIGGRAHAVVTAKHEEVVLEAVQVSEEHDAGLVVLRRRAEDVARQRHRRRKQRVESFEVVGGERVKGLRCGRSDRIEDAEQRVRIPASSPAIRSG